MNQLLKLHGLAHHPFERRTPKEVVYRHSQFGETRNDIQHRLKIAGIGNKPLFEGGALETAFDVSGGALRRIHGVPPGAMIVTPARKQRVVSTQNVHDSHVDRGRP